MKKELTRLTALVLALALLLTSCGGGTSATSMHLRKTEGTVGVSDNEGKDVTPRNNLGLYSGYEVDTQAESYAWIDLDKVKLTKLDADSQIEISKEDKKLEINVKSGSLFFNVTEPLADDESMNIRTSTMAVGIRGTCGWVTQNTAALLEGTVEVTAGDQTVTVNAGEMAVLTPEGTLEVKPFTAFSVPVFVREEVAEDEELAADIQDAAGMDLTGADPMVPYADIINDLSQNNNDILFAGLVDFEADDDPELLIVHMYDGMSEETRNNVGIRVDVSIWRDGSDYVKQLYFMGGIYYRYGTGKISLAGSDGRQYIHCSDIGSDDFNTYNTDQYIGSISEKDSGQDDWGTVDLGSSVSRRGGDTIYRISPQTEDKTVNGGSFECSREEYEAWTGKYTDILDLVIYDGENVIAVSP